MCNAVPNVVERHMIGQPRLTKYKEINDIMNGGARREYLDSKEVLSTVLEIIYCPLTAHFLLFLGSCHQDTRR